MSIVGDTFIGDSFGINVQDAENEILNHTCFYCRCSYNIYDVEYIKTEVPEECPVCYSNHDGLAVLPNCPHKCCEYCIIKIFNHLDRRKNRRMTLFENQRRIVREEKISRIKERLIREFETLEIEKKIHEICESKRNIIESTVIQGNEEMIAYDLILREAMGNIIIKELYYHNRPSWLGNTGYLYVDSVHPLRSVVIDQFEFKWQGIRWVWTIWPDSDSPNEWWLLCAEDGMNRYNGDGKVKPPPPYRDIDANIIFNHEFTRWTAIITENYCILHDWNNYILQ